MPPIVHDVLRSPGQPLDAATLAFMEPRFGHDFSQVRVHADAKAAESTQAVNALAYTVGRDVVFAARQYAPQTSAGQRLLAHELAHATQQGKHAERAEQAMEISDPSDASEHEADAVAQAIGVGDVAAVRRSEPPRIARATENAQPGLVARAKTGFYSALIESQRGPQRLLISTLRRGASALPQGAQGVVELIIDVVEIASDMCISLMLAIVALNVGVVSGLVGLVEGLFRMAAGLLTGISLFIAGVVAGDMGGAKLWLEEVYRSIVGIPAALKALYDSWIAEFKAASTDRQTIMIGELTGQVIALLVPFLLSGGGAAAGRIATVAKQVAGTTARGRAVAAWSSADVIAGGGKTTVVAGEGAGAATRGALALKVQPLEAPVIRPVPKLVPPAPATATAPVGMLAGRTAAIGVGVGASTMTRLAPDLIETDERRCPPVILLLPRAKAQDFDAYAALIGQLEHVPNRPRDTNQDTSWKSLTPGRIPAAVWSRAAALGLARHHVVIPFWSRIAVYDTPMQVDHDIEMQVTPIGREGAFDTPAHHRLMDATSNVGAGAELEHNIRKMREALVTCTRDQGWMYRRLVFERVAASTSNNPGIWTRDDLIAGRHLDAYERLGSPLSP